MDSTATTFPAMFQSPVLWVSVTIIAYMFGCFLNARTGGNPFVNPVAVAVILIIGILVATDTSYTVYLEGASHIHFLLGPAVVALAIPLYNQRHRILESLGPIVIALVVGSLTATTSAVLIATQFDLPPEITASLAPKSVTAPIAIGIAEKIGGIAALAAPLAVMTGITGAILGTIVLRAFSITDPRAVGFALGMTSHGIGTARSFMISEQAGAFSGIAMGLTGLLSALLIPILMR